MQYFGVEIQDTWAEAFGMWASRLIVTAADAYWLDAAVRQVTGYGTSIIGCDAEVGLECNLPLKATPDGRVGASILFFAFTPEKLAKAVVNRVGQCVMTCPTTAVYNGLPSETSAATFELGGALRYFADGHQKSMVLDDQRYWRIPVMEGEFVVQAEAGCVKAVAGGQFLICGQSQPDTLAAARQAVEAIAKLPDVITPFPGGVVRSGSKVGSHYKGQIASTHEAYCPTLSTLPHTLLPPGTTCVYEIIINGLRASAVTDAMRLGIKAACEKDNGLLAITASHYDGKLGKYHFGLHDLMASQGEAEHE